MIRKLLTVGLMTGLFILSACGSDNGAGVSGSPAITKIYPTSGAPNTDVAVVIQNYDATQDVVTFGDVPVAALTVAPSVAAVTAAQNLTSQALVTVPASSVGASQTQTVADQIAAGEARIHYIRVPSVSNGTFNIVVRRGDQTSMPVTFEVSDTAPLAGQNPDIVNPTAPQGGTQVPVVNNYNTYNYYNTYNTSAAGGPGTAVDPANPVNPVKPKDPAAPGLVALNGACNSTTLVCASGLVCTSGTCQVEKVGGVVPVSYMNLTAGVVSAVSNTLGINYYTTLTVVSTYIKSLLLVTPDLGSNTPFYGMADEFKGNASTPFGSHTAVAGVEDLLGLSDLYLPNQYSGYAAYSPVNYCNIPSQANLANQISMYASSLCFNGNSPIPVDSAANYVGIFLPVLKDASSSGTIKVAVPYLGTNAFTLYYKDWSGKMQSQSVQVTR